MKTVFIGNRFPVLEKMLGGDYEPLTVFAAGGSFLERELLSRGMAYTRIENRSGLVGMLQAMDYEMLVSNGCPYILPVSRLDNGARTFVNVHPALLPEQRGAHAVNGAMFYQYGAGATCHIMDDGADTGPVIARVEIPYSPDLDLGLLYQLSFSAEVDAFTSAEARRFRPLETQPQGNGAPVCFARPDAGAVLDPGAGLEETCRQVRAFGIGSQGVRFHVSGKACKTFDAEIVTNAYLLSRREQYRQNEIVHVYGDTLVVRKGEGFIKLKAIQGDTGHLRPGLILE